MNYLQSIKQTLKNHDTIILLSVLAISLPYYICVPILIGEIIYLLYTKKLFDAYKNTPKVKYLIIFMILITIVSLIYQNWVGVGCSALIFIMLSLALYYQHHITKNTFEFILDVLIALSILWALYGLFEQLMILNRLGYGLTLKVFSRRENRLNSVFANANYYAMMIEFILMMITYKVTTIKNNKKRIYYVLVALLNIFLLYMTGCRTALIAIIFGLIIFFIFNKNYKICLVILGLSLCLAGYFIINPSSFPRIERLVGNFDVRLNIWQTALMGIQAHPLFGQGPMTYLMIYGKYNGHITHHSHSVYLDPILSFGIVGVIILIPYIKTNIQRMFNLSKNNFAYKALVMACVAIILIHGTMDYTIFFIHTGMLFLFISLAFQMNINRR